MGCLEEEDSMSRRRFRSVSFSLIVASAAVFAPAWAVSLSTLEPAQPLPDAGSSVGLVDDASAGSAALVPLMAAETQATHVASMDANTRAAGAPLIGKPLDDIAFVQVATETARREADAARGALPQLKAPELRRLAELLVNDHSEATARLSQLAEAKQWPLPPPKAPAAPPAGAAASDFDARWTADMIAGHERSLELYRAQATGGEDKDLRRYARDTLPAIEQHLAQLKSLQK